MRRVDFSLYLITDRRQTAGRRLHVVLQEAVRNGVRAVQVRERDLGARQLLGLSKAVRTMMRECRGRVMVNDRVDLCLSADASGVHLRSDGLPVDVARRLVGAERLIAVSTHTPEEVQRAERQGADFVVLGPIYDTPSKRSLGKPIGIHALSKARALSHIPIFAIGGITLATVGEIMKAGASGCAVISAIMSAPDVGEATRTIIAAIDDSRRVVG